MDKSFKRLFDPERNTERPTMELCRDLLAAHRINCKGREHEPLTENDKKRMMLIGKLSQGPHRQMVLGMIVEYFPDMAGKLGMDTTRVGNA